MSDTTAPLQLHRLRELVVSVATLLDSHPPEKEILEKGSRLLADLIRYDDWLPERYALPHPQYYQQYLLHADSGERFSVVSFVWGPGQQTPVHNHTVWGLIGVLRGAEISQPFDYNDKGQLIPSGAPVTISPGRVEAVSPEIGDLHQVRNAFADKVSISIHIYGANIGAVTRSVFPEEGDPKAFISGYSNDALPNIWDRSKK